MNTTEAIKRLHKLHHVALAVPADGKDYTSGYDVVTMPESEQRAIEAAIRALEDRDALVEALEASNILLSDTIKIVPTNKDAELYLQWHINRALLSRIRGGDDR